MPRRPPPLNLRLEPDLSGRVLFRVANALDTKWRIPIPVVSLTTTEALFFGAFVFTSVFWLLFDALVWREFGPDIRTMSIVGAITGLELWFRPGDRRLHYWLFLVLRTAMIRLFGRLSWGFANMRAIRESFPGGMPDSRAALISSDWSHVTYANARVDKDGILDVTGLPLPGPLRWLISCIFGRAPYRLILEVDLSVVSDMKTSEEQSAILGARSRFWFKLQQPASAHAVVEPMDPDKIAYAAGPEEKAARALAAGTLPGMQRGLMTRRGYLTLVGMTKGQIKDRVRKAKTALAETGRSARPLTQEEVNGQLDKFFGSNRRPPLAIGNLSLQINGERLISYLITRLERTAPLDWMSSLLDGSIGEVTIGLFSWPHSPSSSRAWLSKASKIWTASAIGFGTADYSEALEDAEALSEAIRQPSGVLHEYSLVITVPEAQKQLVEDTLQSGYVPDNGWRIAAVTQADAAKSSQPWGVSSFLERRHCDSQMLGLSLPWMSGELWQPSSIIVGVSLASSEIVGIDPFSDLKLEAWNKFTWGVMGSGKSTAMQLDMRRICHPHPKHPYAAMNPRALVIDHKTSMEWAPLIHDLGGEYIIATCWDDVKNLDVEQKALGINVSRIDPRKRGEFVYQLITKAWDEVAKRPKSEPWPGVIAIDEMHILALTELGRWTISELGKMARDAFWNVSFGTQQMDDVLRRDSTAGNGADGLVAAAIKNSPIRLALKQPKEDRDLLQDRLKLSNAECELLEQLGGDGKDVQAHKGKGLLWYGNAVVPVQVLPLGNDRHVLTMNPQERLRLGKSGSNIDGGFIFEGKEGTTNGPVHVGRTRSFRPVSIRSRDPRRARSRRI